LFTEDLEIQNVKKKIVEALRAKNGPASIYELQSEVNEDFPFLVRGIFELYREGVIERVYSEDFDPTRPFDTAMWILRCERIGAEKNQKIPSKSMEVLSSESTTRDFRLVLSIPLTLHAHRAALLNKYSAMDIFDAFEYIVNLAEDELKIICPFLDAYGFFPVINKLHKSPSLKVRIITEIDKSREIEYFADVAGPGKIEVVDAQKIAETSQGGRRKIEGVHAKLAIADEQAALIGSFNFSRYHYLVNFDAGFLVHSKSIVRLLSDLFEELWRHVASKH